MAHTWPLFGVYLMIGYFALQVCYIINMNDKIKRYPEFSEYLKEELKDPEFAVAYLSEAYASKDRAFFARALHRVLKDVPQEEHWLFDPKNKELVQELKNTLKQKARIRIDLDELDPSLPAAISGLRK